MTKLIDEQDLIEIIESAANRSLAEWNAHFKRFYHTECVGDREKIAGVTLGVESLRDSLIRAITSRERNDKP